MLKLREVGIGHMDDERDSSSRGRQWAIAIHAL